MEIKFKTKGMEESRTVNVDIPEGLDALVQKYGAEYVASAATDSLVISAQALGRRHIEKSDEELATIFANWDPTTRAAAVSRTPLEKATSALANLTVEEKAALLAKLTGG